MKNRITLIEETAFFLLIIDVSMKKQKRILWFWYIDYIRQKIAHIDSFSIVSKLATSFTQQNVSGSSAQRTSQEVLKYDTIAFLLGEYEFHPLRTKSRFISCTSNYVLHEKSIAISLHTFGLAINLLFSSIC